MDAKSIRILLVEDDEHDRVAFRRAFKKARVPAEITVCEKAEDALERIHTDAGLFDLAVVDHKLPGMSGLDLCKTVLAEEVPLPLVILTGKGSEAVAVEGMKAGTLDYVVKSHAALSDIPHIIRRAMREWDHIIERKRAEEALGDSIRQWHATFDAMNDAVSFIDLEGTFLRCNTAMTELLGKSHSDIVGQTCYKLMHQSPEPIEGCPLVRMRKTRRRETMTLPIGDRWFDITVDPMIDEDGHLAGGVHIITDITERKGAEDELRAAHEDLARKTAELERVNAELSEYASATSHDIRAPLRAIHNYADFLREDLAMTLDGEQKEYLDGLCKAVSQAEALNRDMLALYRVGTETLETESIDIGVFLRELIASANLSEEVEIKVADDWPTIDAPLSLMRQIFQNLIDNAVKFNRSARKLIELGWRPVAEDHYEIFVRDNGIGIEPRYHEQIFGIFQRLHTKDEVEGTGIGLAVVKKTVTMLDGSIRVESTPGEGSTFFVMLPKKARGSQR